MNQFLKDCDLRLQHLIVGYEDIKKENKPCKLSDCTPIKNVFIESQAEVKKVLCEVRGTAEYDDEPIIADYQQLLDKALYGKERNYREMIILMQTINQLEYMKEILQLSIDNP